MSVRSFDSMYSRFCRRSNQISEAFLAPTPSLSQDTVNCEFVHHTGKVQLVNRLLILWGEYSRNLVIASAYGNATTISGLRLVPAPGVRTLAHIKAALGRNFGAGPGTRWEETVWATQQASQLNPVNQHQIIQGLATAPDQSLKLVRNYLVHPNEFTRRNYYNDLIPKYSRLGLEPHAFLTSRLQGGTTVIESWIADFQIAAYNAAL